MLLADLPSSLALTLPAASGEAVSRPGMVGMVVGLAIVLVSVVVPMPAVV